MLPLVMPTQHSCVIVRLGGGGARLFVTVATIVKKKFVFNKQKNSRKRGIYSYEEVRVLHIYISLLCMYVCMYVTSLAQEKFEKN